MRAKVDLRRDGCIEGAREWGDGFLRLRLDDAVVYLGEDALQLVVGILVLRKADVEILNFFSAVFAGRHQ